MARVARGAGLPFPVTVAFAGRQGVVEWAGERAGEARRFVLKSRHSRRSNPVPVVGTPRELAAVAAAWADEPLVVQDFADGDGWDHKFWVIGDRVFAGLRLPPEGVAGASERPAAPTAHGASGLASTADPAAAAGSSPPVGHPPAAKRTVELPPDAVPPDWSGLVRRVGDAFGLSVYGVDLLAASAGPVIVDINAFPGFQGVTGAPEALAELAAEIVAAAESRAGAGQVTDAPLP
ncbi:hypothetical protein ACPA54_05215 [Uniformispora flossi]|uniref:hypothetical protein n=1 Tax=Uniformispora flossi TaxID=3390723 RepID=UPI003C2CEB57